MLRDYKIFGLQDFIQKSRIKICASREISIGNLRNFLPEL